MRKATRYFAGLVTLLLLLVACPEGFAQGQVKRNKTTPATQNTSRANTERAKKPTSKRGMASEGTKAGHAYVDLGLSVKWATCNLGASSPDESGDFYGWGETRTKSEFTEGNSLTFGKTASELRSMGIINGAGVLNPAYDAATVNWGKSWRMPTLDEINELRNSCQWTWTSLNGINGYRVTGPNGKSIFLPAAGSRSGYQFYDVGRDGNYYSSSAYMEGNRDMWFILFRQNSVDVGWYVRFGGRSIRPVTK